MLTEDKRLIRACRRVLGELLECDLDTYIDLFFYEIPVLLDSEHGRILEKAGILGRTGSKWHARVMAFPFRGKFIVTDFLLSPRRKKNGSFARRSDDVWVMYPFETLAFIKSMDSDLRDPSCKNRVALDLASGSGAISLFLADRFKKVVSADRNPKAVRYARFNAILNGLEERIVNLRTDIFSNLSGKKFDYIVWNGPTGPLPEIKDPKKYYPQYYYGGSDGAEFTIKFLQQVSYHVKEDFKIKFLDASLGTDKMSVTEEHIMQHMSCLPIRVRIDFLNKDGKKPLRDYRKLYEKHCADEVPMNIRDDENYRTALRRWEDELRRRRLYYFYFSYISITPSGKFEIEHTYPEKSSFLPRHEFGFDWHFSSRKYIKKYLRENSA